MTHVEFVINKEIISNMITHLKCIGKDNEGNNITMVDDAIIRVSNDHIWSIVTGETPTLIASAKIDVKVISKSKDVSENEICIDLNEFENIINRFNSTDDLHIVYEKGLIYIFKYIEIGKKKEKLEYFFTTINKAYVKNDVILGIERAEGNRGENMKKYMLKNHNTYILSDDGNSVELSTGVTLKNKIILNNIELKNIIKDGDTIDNRIYPIEIKKDSINVSIESMLDNTLKIEGEDTSEAQTKGVKRPIITKEMTVEEEFVEKYDNALSSAVSSLSGEVTMFLAKEKSLLIIKYIDKPEIDMAYILLPYRSK